jgi:hypothetical protein
MSAMGTERRHSPRVPLVGVPCTLRRARGSAIRAETIDLGPGGLCVSTSRPLATDEVLRLDLPLDHEHRFDGRVRVLRQERYGVYALRFEQVSKLVLEELQHVVASRP